VRELRSSLTAACFAAVAATSLALIPANDAAAQGANADQAEIDQGKATYARTCSHCHGPNMVNSGTITPDLRRFPDEKDRFFNTVKMGKSNRMPPWGDLLNDEQIASLWAYVSSQRKP
jgi:mono/diheme cytochrome c family protein